MSTFLRFGGDSGTIWALVSDSKIVQNSKCCPSAVQKVTKNRLRCAKNRFWDVFWTRLFSKAGLGRIWGGFGEDLGWILKVADHIVDSYFAQCHHVRSTWDKL